MRYTEQKLEPLKDGDYRIISKFLLIPRTLPLCNSETMQTRWLETAKIRQKYKYTKPTIYPLMAANIAWLFINGWKNICWESL